MLTQLAPLFVGAAIGLVVIGGVVATAAGAPTPEERFARCMVTADGAGLMDERRDDAALVCLESAFGRREGDRTAGPTVGVTTGGQPVIMP